MEEKIKGRVTLIMGEITVVVIDDHPLFRQGVVNTLSLEADILVVAEAADGQKGLRLVRQLRPKVAVVDINLPGMNGLQLAQQISTEKLGVRVILVTAYDDDEQKIHALNAGAAAYCSKDVQPEKLVDVVRYVNSGGYYLDDRELDHAEVMKWLGQRISDAKRVYGDPGEPYQPLSAREMEVLTHIVDGRSNKEIAVALGISPQTVKNHVTAILRKLGVDDRTQAALYAIRRGWVRFHQQDS
jgi:DNA-binding NarL/FixJ family response regulator